MAVLAPTTKTKVVEGKTDEFAVTSSTYGFTWPLVRGTQRLPGNVIWADNIREERTVDVQTTGGKGGQPKQETKTVTYRYYVDLAVAFAEGRATQVRRIWADGKVIYDATGAEVDRIDGLQFTFYEGSETQQPDPVIEANVGEGLTPAYRSLTYIVFNDLPLSNFGNRIPSLTAELVFQGEGFSTEEQVILGDLTGTGPSENNITDSVVIDVATSTIYAEIDLPGTAGGLVSWNLAQGLNAVGTRLNDTHPLGTDGLRVFMTTTKDIIIQKAEDSFISDDIALLSAPYSGSPAVTDTNLAQTLDGQMAQIAGTSFIVWNSTDNSAISNPNCTVVSASTPNTPVDTVDITGVADLGMCVSGAAGEAWSVIRNSSNQLEIRKATGSGLTLVDTINASEVHAGSTAFSGNIVMAYDPLHQALVIGLQTNSAGPVIFSWATTGSILWSNTDLPHVWAIPKYEDGAVLVGNRLVFGNGARRLTAVDLSSGEIDPDIDGTEDVLSGSGQVVVWYEPLNQLWVEIGTDIVLVGGDGFSPRGIIREVAARANLQVTDLDLTFVPLSLPGVQSFYADERSKASDILQNVLDVLQVDPYESDGKLKFRARGAATSVVTITEDEFIQSGSTDGEVYIRPRTEESELPYRFEVSYDDFEQQYQEGLQYDQRSALAVQSRDTDSLRWSGAMSATAARQIAQKQLYEKWNEQERIKTQLPWKYSYLDPTDIVTFNLDNGDSIRGRLRAADIGANLIMEVEQVVETQGVFVADVPGYAGEGNIVTLPPFVGDSSTFLFDTPLLRDADAGPAGQTNTYWSASGEEVWNGVVLYREQGDTLVQEVGKQLAPIPFGVIVTPPPDADDIFVFQEDQSLEIRVTRGEELFESKSKLDVLNGANTLLIRKANGEVEFLQFVDVEVDAGDDQLLTLSNLLRGRRGTDTMANGIAEDDEVFLMLSSTYVNAFKEDTSTLNSATDYRGVTVGQYFEDAESQEFTDTGRDLKPYSVAQIEVVADGSDLDFSWVRRTRIGGNDDYGDTVTDVPLAEDSESYDLVIYTDDTYATEARVINVSSESATYTAAQITTDGDPSTIYFKIFQRSATVGRGFATEQSTPRNP